MSQDLQKYVRTPMVTSDLRTYMNAELAKIQQATDTFFQMLGVLNMLAGFTEGDFKPSIVGGTTAGAATYTGQVARYSKLGRLVFITGSLQWSGHTGTGNMFISPVPFAVDPAMAGTPIFLVYVSATAGLQTSTGFIDSAGRISIQTVGGTAPQAVQAAGDIRFCGAYYSNT
jgi:hypothetical protein